MMREATTKYQPSTLIGNWNEDRELQRSLLKELITARMTGTGKLGT